MLKIEIRSINVMEISGISKAGKPYNMRKQPAWAYTYDQATGKPQDFPERIEVNLADKQDPFPIGQYILHPSSFFVGDFHQLQIGRPVLDALKAAQVVQPRAA